MQLVCLGAIVLCAVSASASFLSNLPKCNRFDSKFDECLKSAIESTLPVLAKAVPELNISSIEPILVSELFIFPTERMPFAHNYYNIKLYHHSLTTIKLLESKITDSTFWLKIEGYNPNILFKSDYTFENAILLGQDVASTGNVTFAHHEYNFEMVMLGKVSDSRQLSVSHSSVSMTAEKFVVEFFTENDRIGRTLSDIVTNNWKFFFSDVKDQFSSVYADAYKNIANSIFAKINFDDLFPKK